MDREGLEPSQEVCKTSMQPLHHQPLGTIAEAGLEPAADTVYETVALPLSYSAANYV